MIRTSNTTNASARGVGNVKFSIIVPTLNEAEYIPRLLTSLQNQAFRDFQVIIVDGGSTDNTHRIAESYGARVYVQKGFGEFAARNFGAAQSTGSVLIFTCADVVLPPSTLEMLAQFFTQNPRLAAITLPGIPYDGPLALNVEYRASNLTRFLLCKLPRPLTRFITSTNFLALKKQIFQRIGGFKLNDVNADGLMGRSLAEQYQVRYDHNANVYISARRAHKSGLLGFNSHYFYVLEDYFPGLSRRNWFANLKAKTLHKHKELHFISETRQTRTSP